MAEAVEDGDEPEAKGPSREAAIAIVRAASLLALGFALALVVDSTRATPAFCAVGSGCDKVRHSDYSNVGGIPISVIGVVSFSSLFMITFFGVAGRRFAALLAMIGAVGGVFLFGLQALVIHAFCKLCLVVDVSSLVAGVAGLVYVRAGRIGKVVATPLGWLAIAIGAAATPVMLGDIHPDTVAPPEVKAFFVPGKINIVEFSDFECPFCRKLHPDLLKLVAAQGPNVSFVRLSLPLNMHPHAKAATRAYLCAQKQNKGEEMADMLFSVEPLTDESGDEAATALKLDLPAFRACEKDAATEAEMEKDGAIVRKTDFRGLPTVWIEDEKILGAQPPDVLEEAIAAAKQGPRSNRGAYLRLAGMFFLVIGFFIFAQTRRAKA